MNPYESTSAITTNDPEADRSLPRVIDAVCWCYPVVFALIALGATLFLRASSISISPMSYDFYYEKAGYWQQFWYDATLLFLIFSPLAALFSPLVQLAWSGRTLRIRYRFVVITILIWICVPLFFAVINVPIIDYLID